MKRTLADGAGYLVIDHRDSPGLTPADVAHVPGAVAVPGGVLYERDSKTCSHCQRQVALNPGRVRARAVCPKCHAYICDECEGIRVAAGGACIPFKQVLDRAWDLVDRNPESVPDLAALSAPAEPRVVVPGKSVE